LEETPDLLNAIFQRAVIPGIRAQSRRIFLLLRRLARKENVPPSVLSAETAYFHDFTSATVRDCEAELQRELRAISGTGKKLRASRRSLQPERSPARFSKDRSKTRARTGAKLIGELDRLKPLTINAGTATWETIEISFLSDERVQIGNGTDTETRNYSELGFSDGRTGKPNQAWVILRALAEERGVIRDGMKTGLAWPKIEKRMQDIRKVLRKNFGISADPIPFVKGTGYQARFKIGCSPSFHT
jgi:hypothetical protein